MKTALLTALLTLSGSIAFATPAEVLIIRHGEKTAQAENNKDASLSAQGYKRAAALPKLFMEDQRMLDFGTPVAIYAGAPKKKSGSQRPLQTIEPTAKALGLKPITDFESPDDESMVADVMKNPKYKGKTVLISWPHDEIPHMAHKFGIKKKKVPDWPGDVFDRVWKIKFDKDDVSSFEDLPQHVLPGDSKD